MSTPDNANRDPYFLTPAQFIAERSGWFDVSVQQKGDGDDRYDVVLRIDGAYTHRADAEEMAEYFAEELRHLAARALKNRR
jgi:hypothetical protein